MDDDVPRLHRLNEASERTERAFVLYWMQASMRADDNAALHHAIGAANRLELPCVVVYALGDEQLDTGERQAAFLLEGLAHVHERLDALGIRLVGRRGDPVERVAELAERAALVVTDTVYLQPERGWCERLAATIDVPLHRIESDVVVPVEQVSDKREYAARTIRSKLAERRDDRRFGPVSRLEPSRSSIGMHLDASDGGRCDLSAYEALLGDLDVDRDVPRVKRFRGGMACARERLTSFLRGPLDGYADGRREVERRGTSELSPYLRYGHIGLGEIVEKLRAAGDAELGEDAEALLEELIVRRELSRNYVWYTKDYADYAALPDWARDTLDEHEGDERPARYTRAELEAADTDDDYWNAAMREMKHTGYMHNSLRMYWGKKVLEWCNTPAYAHRTLLYLNNKYFLDGRDPNSFANVGWVFGLHDRPWQEREVFGKVRYMNANGLDSKFDMAGYRARVDELIEAEGIEPADRSD